MLNGACMAAHLESCLRRSGAPRRFHGSERSPAGGGFVSREVTEAAERKRLPRMRVTVAA